MLDTNVMTGMIVIMASLLLVCCLVFSQLSCIMKDLGKLYKFDCYMFQRALQNQITAMHLVLENRTFIENLVKQTGDEKAIGVVQEQRKELRDALEILEKTMAQIDEEHGTLL